MRSIIQVDLAVMLLVNHLVSWLTNLPFDEFLRFKFLAFCIVLVVILAAGLDF